MADPYNSREKQLAYQREWMRKWKKANPKLVAFYNQRTHAKRRHVAFLMTFEEWWSIWKMSGKWEQRGRHSEQYVMARFRDSGPYSVGNVRICTGEENRMEQAANLSDETRQRKSAANKARPPISDETRRRLSVAAKAYLDRNPGVMTEIRKARWAHKRTQ